MIITFYNLKCINSYEKKIELFDYYYNLRDLPDSFFSPKKDNHPNLTKSFFIWNKGNFIHYFDDINNNNYIYLPAHTNDSRQELDRLVIFLTSKNIVIDQKSDDLLEQVTDLVAFSQNFITYFTGSNKIFHVGYNNDSKLKIISQHNRDDEYSSDDSDIDDENPYLDMQIELIDHSKLPYTHLE